MLPALTGPVLIAAVLLALAAPGKWRRPDDTVRALKAVRLPASRAAVRALAVGELALGTAVVLIPSRPVLALLALSYLGFGAFVALALRSGTPLASCGCFGRPDTPPTRVHLGVVLAAAGAAATGSASLLQALDAPWAGLPLLAAVAVGAWLAWASLSLLPAGGGAASDTSAGSTGGRPQTPVFVDPGSFLHLDVAGQGENGRTISLVRRTEVSGAPTGVLQTGRPMYYLAWSPGWRAGKPQPAPRSIAQACPPDTPPSGFSDVPPGSTHAAAVDCAVRWGVVRGTSPTSYSPERGVPRDQMAAFVARTVEATGAQLPEPSRDHFSDDDQSVHEQAINALAEAGIVNGRTPGAYAPGVLVTRAQMAAFLVRAWDVVAAQTGTEPLPPSEDWFFDDAATPLRTDIDKAAGVGFTGGTGPGRYSPYEGVQRGQMASFVVRLLDLAVERGVAQAPPPA